MYHGAGTDGQMDAAKCIRVIPCHLSQFAEGLCVDRLLFTRFGNILCLTMKQIKDCAHMATRTLDTEPLIISLLQNLARIFMLFVFWVQRLLFVHCIIVQETIHFDFDSIRLEVTE